MSQQTILVTGATGLAGSNVCKLGVEGGYRVLALVRSRADTEPLLKCGAELVPGDISDPASLDAPMRGVDAVIHCAAQIGGSWSTATAKDYETVNQWGSINVLAAAERAAVGRTVMLLTNVLFERTETLDENSHVIPISTSHSAYTRTKLAAFYESMARASRGQDIVFVIPGAIYGPSPIVDRALVPTSFNSTLLKALRGELKRYLDMPLSWAFAEDVARVSLLALAKGQLGARYLACGRAEDSGSLPRFCNRMLEIAGLDHRATLFNPADPGAANDSEFGTMLKYLRAEYPDPLHDCRHTTEALAFQPTSLDAALTATLAWFRRHGRF